MIVLAKICPLGGCPAIVEKNDKELFVIGKKETVVPKEVQEIVGKDEEVVVVPRELLDQLVKGDSDE